MSAGNTNGCACAPAPTLIFSCSGGADVGELADRAARKLTRDGKGKMYCLAGVGGRVGGILKSTESASGIMVIDGCPLDCAKKTLREAGFSDFAHFRLTDLGCVKGATEVGEARVAEVAAMIAPA